MSSAIQQLAARLNRLERDVRSMATTPHLAYSSIEGGGSIDANAADGTTMAQFGGQFDGSFGAMALVGPIPPTPSTPIVAATRGGLTVYWDGLFIDAQNAPMDFSRIEVHISTVNDFMPNMASTLWTTIETPRGATVVVRLPVDLYYVKLVARSLSGAAGYGSDQNSAISGAEMSDLSVYATNADAITGGVGVGSLYRSGADPDIVCVVH